MFPYRPRKPAWGSVRPKSDAAPDGSGRGRRGRPAGDGDTPSDRGPGGAPALLDGPDPLAVGGNLQRAILLDMIGLRDAYRRAETPPGRRRQAHAPGSSFGRFKRAFAGLRFAALHTRTIPPRVDRGEYVQLLYSSCFFLLEAAFGDPPALGWDEGGGAPDAVFAAFLLYALRETDVLPPARAPRDRAPRGPGGGPAPSSLLGSWSMLPLGLEAKADDKLGRRAFRRPVRVDRWCYHLLLRLRDACQGRVDECQLEILSRGDSDGDSDSDGGDGGGDGEGSYLRHFGLARDAVSVVDRMVRPDSDFFAYCEYHGPVSLEGLAGFPNFYRAHFVGREGAPGGDGTERDDGGGTGLGTVLTAMARSRGAEGTEEPEESDGRGPALDGGDGGDATEGPPEAPLAPASGPPDLVSFDEAVAPAVREAMCGRMVTFRDEVEAVRDGERRRYEPAPEETARGARGDGDGDVIEVDPVLELLLRGDDGPRPRGKGGAAPSASRGRGRGADAEDVSVATGAGKRALASLLGAIGGGSDDEDEPARPRKRRGGRAARKTGGGKKGDPGSADADEVSVATGAGKRALQSLLGSMEGGSDDEDEPARPRKRRGGRAARKTGGGGKEESAPEDVEANADEVSVATGAGKRALRSLFASMDTDADDDDSLTTMLAGEGSSDDGEETSREGDADGADFSSIRDDDGAASVYSGMGKRALGFLLSQSSRPEE